MKFIPLTEIQGKSKLSVIKFISDHEFLNVQFTSILKKNISNAYAVYINEIRPQELYGIIGIRKTVFHILPFAKTNSQTALQQDFIQSFKDFYKKEKFSNPICINGQKDGTELLLQCFTELGINSLQQNEYNLLKLDAKKFLINLKKSEKQKKDFIIFRCKKDIEENLKKQVLELQYLYEKEEVIPECFSFDENLSRLRFSNSLRSQYILALLFNGRIIAKAGTNAIGFKYVQLGGIFTLKDFRRQHFSKLLLQTLLFRLLRIKKSVVLFVKKENIPANNLYNSLSFNKISEYLIAYFKPNL